MIGYKKVFLDTAPIIYFIEHNDLYYEKIRTILQQLLNQDAMIFTSAITVEEYEVGPFRKGDLDSIRRFEMFIDDLDIHLINIDRSIAARAASMRSEYVGYKAMDALQISSAISAGCDLFVTNDKQLRQTQEILCHTVDEL